MIERSAEVETLQRNLASHNFPVGSIDGALGARTITALMCFCTDRLSSALYPFGAAMADHFPAAGITSRQRVTHFLAQAAEETNDFMRFEEVGGPHYFARYDGRADLGNTQPGDGDRYHGRGIFMLTGRVNYRAYGKSLSLDLEGSPALADEPNVAVQIACLFWDLHNLNALADENDLSAITRRINGGENGLSNRRYYLDRLQLGWPT